MESIGRLAAGLAHEVKNPLGIILMGVGYMSDNLQATDENVPVVLREMRDAVERADVIIRELLDFSALSRLELCEEDVKAVVERALSLVRHELSHHHIRVVKRM